MSYNCNNCPLVSECPLAGTFTDEGDFCENNPHTSYVDYEEEI